MPGMCAPWQAIWTGSRGRTGRLLARGSAAWAVLFEELVDCSVGGALDVAVVQPAEAVLEAGEVETPEMVFVVGVPVADVCTCGERGPVFEAEGSADPPAPDDGCSLDRVRCDVACDVACDVGNSHPSGEVRSPSSGCHRPVLVSNTSSC